MKYTRFVLTLSLALLASPQAGTAQEVSWTYRANTGGWVGITVDFLLTPGGEQEQTVLVISEVAEGSPAEEAGIRVGDAITHLDGRAVSQKLFSSFRQGLKAGDMVRILVDREGMSQEFLVEAGESPTSHIVVGPDAERMVIELETLSGNILKNLDSLRLSFGGVHLDSLSDDMRVQVVRVPGRTDEGGEVSLRFQLFEPFIETLTFPPGDFVMVPDFAMPFEALIVESRATAPLKEELARLRKELTAVRRDELARRRELAAAIQGPIEEVLRKDEQIREIRLREEDLLTEQKEISAHLRQVSEEEMRRQWVEVQARNEAALMEARHSQFEALSESRREREDVAERARNVYQYSNQFRSPIIMGQNFMLGAQLAPLNPQLAEYFPVDEGVFVVEVMEDTPASDAGLQGGDIIVRLAGDAVTSLSDLRFGLGAFEGPLRIRVIRKGNPVEILIRR